MKKRRCPLRYLQCVCHFLTLSLAIKHNCFAMWARRHEHETEMKWNFLNWTQHKKKNFDHFFTHETNQFHLIPTNVRWKSIELHFWGVNSITNFVFLPAKQTRYILLSLYSREEEEEEEKKSCQGKLAICTIKKKWNIKREFNKRQQRQASE